MNLAGNTCNDDDAIRTSQPLLDTAGPQAKWYIERQSGDGTTG
jgi:hypothetical protein